MTMKPLIAGSAAALALVALHALAPPVLAQPMLAPVATAVPATAAAAPAVPDYAMAAGDVVRVQVFQNPDLTLESRISESGTVTMPLIGAVRLGGLSAAEAERRIASALEGGGFIQRPQVTVLLLQIRGSQVSVLGQVGRPGRFPLETARTRLSDMLALAGGALPAGDDVVVVTGVREGQPFRREVDIPALFLPGGAADADLVLQGGDVIFVHRAPTVYVFGQAQRPGAFRIEREMTVMQALALAGGPTPRGSLNRLQLHRSDGNGGIATVVPRLSDPVRANDVIYVRESLF
jgi:polysaccharide export outer membrane protein